MQGEIRKNVAPGNTDCPRTTCTTGARGEAGVADQVSGSAESLNGQRLGDDEQCPVGTDAGHGLEQRHSRDLLAHVLDPTIEGPDHRYDLVDEGPLHVDEQTPLGSEQGPRHVAHPLASILGEQTPTLQTCSWTRR